MNVTPIASALSLALFFDTETTGLPLFKEPSEHPAQPHIVQIGARLVDMNSRRIVGTLDVICRPDGWTIPEEVSAIHGITTEHALAVGVPEPLALRMLLEMWECAEERIGHNVTFDDRIVRIAQHRFGLAESELEAWKNGPTQCTQALSTPICKLPATAKMRAAGRNHHKSANLREAFEFFTGRELVGAHSALVDVDACIAVFWAIRDGVTERVSLPLAA
jgi:DNA polymerase III subunit epsilon